MKNRYTIPLVAVGVFLNVVGFSFIVTLITMAILTAILIASEKPL